MKKELIMNQDLVMRDSDGSVFSIRDGTEICFILSISTENREQISAGVESNLTAAFHISVKENDWFLSDTENSSSNIIRSDQIRKIPVIGLMLYANCITQLFKVATKHG